ncbi:MAG: PAS domain S-box protein [Bacteroidia bacterium]|nr:PAS domain S-box protein [Bacteroidia bacterium]
MESNTLQDKYLQFIRAMRFDLGLYRALAIFAATSLPLFRGMLPTEGNDPIWVRLLLGGIILTIFLSTFVSGFVRKKIAYFGHFVIYSVTGWATWLVWLNGFANPYLINFFVVLLFAGINFKRLSAWWPYALTLLGLGTLACLLPHPNGINLWGYLPMLAFNLLVSAVATSFRITIQSELNRQKHLVSSIFESSPDAIFMANSETLEVTDSNQNARLMFGLTGLNNKAQLHVHLTTWLQTYLADRDSTERLGRGTGTIPTLDKRTIVGEIVITEVRSSQGNQLLVAISDITDKQAIAKRLQLSDDILQKVDHIVLVCDADSNVVYATPSVRTMLGYDPREVLGQGWWNIKKKSGADPAEDKNYIRDFVTGQVPAKKDLYESRHIDAHGKEQFILWKDSLTANGLIMGVGMLNTKNHRDEVVRKVVFSIAEGSSKAQNPSEFYQFIHHEIRRIIDTPNFYVAVYDSENDEVSFPYYSDAEDSVVVARVSRKRKAGNGLTEYGIKRRKAVLLVKDDILDLQVRGQVSVAGSIPEVWLGVPLIHDDQVVGLITIQDYERSDAYSQEDLTIVTFIANQVAQFVAKLQADEALRMSEERFRSIYDQAAVGIAQLTPEGKFLQVNQKMEEIFGYSAEELSLMVPADFTHPDDVDLGREELIDVLDGKRDSYTKEKRYRHKSGAPVYALLNVSAYRENGEPIFIISVYEDITEKKRAQGETELLLRLSSGLNTAESMNDAVAITLEELAGFDDWGYATAYWLDQAGNYQLCSEKIAEDETLAQLSVHERFDTDALKQMTLSGKILWHDDPELQTFKEVTALAKELAVNTVAFLPIVHQGKAIVVIWLMSREGTFDRRSLEKIAGAVRSQLLAVHFRKMAEAARIESENRYRAITQAAFEGIAIYQNGRILDANAAFAKIFSFEQEDLIQMELADLIYAESPEETVTEIDRGDKSGVEFMGRKKGGESIHLEALSRSDTWQGQPARILAIRDITSQKLMEEARESARLDARFKAYIQNSSEIIKIIEPDGRIAYCSPSYAKIFGIEAESVVGMNNRELVAAEDHAAFETALEEVLRSPLHSLQLQIRAPHQDGHDRILQVTLTNLMDDPMVKGVLISEGDITHVIEAQNSMRESEARFKLLFERSPDAIFVESEHGQILDLNEAACQLHEMTREELLGQFVADLAAPGERETVLATFPDLMSGKINYLEGLTYTKTGKVVGIEIRCNVINFQNRPALLLLVRDISERKKAESLLKESEERFRALVEHATEAIFVLDVDANRLIEVNMNAELLFGRSREELMHISPASLSPHYQANGDQSIEIEQALVQRALQGELMVYEWLFVNADQEEIPCEIRLNRFPSATRQLVRGSVTDITARKQAELKMQRSREMLRIQNEHLIELAASHELNSGDLDVAFEYISKTLIDLLKVTRAGIWLFDANAEWLVCKKEFDTETGTFVSGDQRRTAEYPRYFELVQSQRVLAIEDAANSDAVLEFRERSIAPKGIASTIDAPFRHGGRVAGMIWLKQMHTKRTWEPEEINLVATMADMVTLALQSWERKKAENALRDSERNNKALLDGIPDLIVRITEKGTILDFKQSDQQDLIQFFEGAIGSPIESLLPETMAGKLLSFAKKAIEIGEIQQFESEVILESGATMDYETRIVRSGPQEVLVIVRDVTERKRTEKELIKRNFELDSFVYRASHDLKAPLNSLMGLIGLVESETQEAAVLSYIKMMNKSVVKLDTFIRDLADFSRNARSELDHSPIDWAAMLNETLENLQFADHADRIQKNIEVTFEGPFYSDPVRIGIIFNNLISNAIKYQNLKRSDSKVDVTISRVGDQARIEIKDNGIGIAKEHQAKVYNLFFRASIQSYGSGMGMYIVKNAIERLKGHISMHSEEGEGTTFVVLLPDLGPSIPQEPLD